MRQLCLFFLLFLCSCSFLCSSSTSHNRLKLRFNKDNQSVIKNAVDLKGDTLFLPSNSTLVFNGGVICSGTVVGDNSKIIAERKNVFYRINVSGTWRNDTVYSKWLDFSQDSMYDNRVNFQNLMKLSNGSNHTDVFMEKGVFWTSTRENGSAIRLPSNTTWHCSATIKELPHSFQYASLLKVYKVKNVVIDGGVYVGDLEKHKGNIGEWSHGIECRASSNVTIKNVICKEFWGDGIDVIDGYDDNLKPTLNCFNVVIENAKCFYNRRTGIGLEAVIGCQVSNSVCMYNGSRRGTGPKAGIGIEAWNKENEKIKNIVIEHCNFTHNPEYGLFCYANGPFKGDFVNYNNIILVRDCKIGMFFVSYTNGIILEDCEILDTKGYEYEYVKGLEYRKCVLKKKRLNKKINSLPKK